KRQTVFFEQPVVIHHPCCGCERFFFHLLQLERVAAGMDKVNHWIILTSAIVSFGVRNSNQEKIVDPRREFRQSRDKATQFMKNTAKKIQTEHGKLLGFRKVKRGDKNNLKPLTVAMVGN